MKKRELKEQIARISDRLDRVTGLRDEDLAKRDERFAAALNDIVAGQDVLIITRNGQIMAGLITDFERAYGGPGMLTDLRLSIVPKPLA